MASVIRGDDNFDSGSIADNKADVYGYAQYRSGTATLYPGFNVGTYINHGAQQTQIATGTFTGGSYPSGPNYGTTMWYGSIAVRTG